jgi:hypothetical protein
MRNLCDWQHRRYALISGMPRYLEVIYPVKKVIGLTAEMAECIREFRFRRRIDSENEAIRQLIKLGLKAAEQPPS